MYTYYGDFLLRANDYLIKLLQADPYVSGIVGQRVSIQHPGTQTQPVYPLVVLSVSSLGDDPSIEQISNAFISVDIYSQVSAGEAFKTWVGINPDTQLPAGIRALLHNQSKVYTEVRISKMWVVWANPAAYDTEVRAWHLSARLGARIVGRTRIL